MKRLLFILSMCLSLLAYAQPKHKKSNPWRAGKVILENGDTLHCRMRLTRLVTEGLVEILNGNQARAMTVKDVKAFSFFDEKKNKTRHFYTLPVKPELSSRKHEVFIEYIYGNEKLSILTHKTLGLTPYQIEFNPFQKKSVVEQPYLLDNQSGTVVPLSKENALQLMKEERREVLNYIQSNGVKLKRVSDFIDLLEYHQSLL